MKRAFPIRNSSAFFAALVLCCSATLSAQDAPHRQPVIYLVAHPDAAPDFLLANLDGKPLSLVGAKGKVILLNFWATWCGPCRAETQDLIELQNKYKDSLQVIGLAVDVDDEAEVKSFVESSGINYLVAVAPV